MQRKHRMSERLYAVLLHLYPKAFRTAYGQQMRQTFRDACRAAYQQNGAGGLVALWLPTLLDLFKSALAERVQGAMTMSKEKLIALAGPLTILVGALWLITSIGNFLIEIGLGGGEAFFGLWILPFFLSFVPLLFALIGTRLRFHPSAGIGGRVGLALSVAGGAGVIVAVLATMLGNGGAPVGEQPLWLNYAAVVSFLSIRIGYLLFGVDVLRYRLLPRWKLLPLLLGATLVLSLPFDWFGAPAILPSSWVTPFLHFVTTGVCWVLLGLAMLDQQQEAQSTTASYR